MTEIGRRAQLTKSGADYRGIAGLDAPGEGQENADMVASMSTANHQVVIFVGEPAQSLLDGLRALGLVQIVLENAVHVWSRPVPSEGPRESQMTGPGLTTAPGAPGLLMTVTEAALSLGVSRSTLYELIGRRELEVVHIGRSARVPVEALHALVERMRCGIAAGSRSDGS